MFDLYFLFFKLVIDWILFCCIINEYFMEWVSDFWGLWLNDKLFFGKENKLCCIYKFFIFVCFCVGIVFFFDRLWKKLVY